MTTVRINPEQVRGAGIAATTCADDLRGQAGILQALTLPAMPPAMAARHEAALATVAARLGALAGEVGALGEELQVRAAAAEVADAPGDARSAAAGRTLARSVTTATIVGAAGAATTVTLSASGARVEAATSTGLRVTIPDALERGHGPAATAAAAAADPHEAAHERPVASREVAPVQEIGGAPAAAVQAAAVLPVAAGGGASVLGGHAADLAAMAPGEHRAVSGGRGGTVPAPAREPAADSDDRQDWACWMASSAAHAGLPPALPVMLALAHGGLRNMPAGEHDVGFFGLDPSSARVPPGAGLGPDAQPGADWWSAHPGAQLDDVLQRLHDAGGGIRTPGLDDPDALGRWAAEAAPGIDASQLQDAHTAAGELVDNCRQIQGAGASGGAGGALAVARGQLGVHELGTNAGPQVNAYLASAGVGSGNPWCASFVDWSLHESGHDMPGHGWAAVSTWVHAAEAGQHGLQFVDPSAARPGDIVAYDFGGGSDFGADGHIGFLDSGVHDGHFTAVEGNASDAVTRMDRSMTEGNVVFIRLAA